MMMTLIRVVVTEAGDDVAVNTGTNAESNRNSSDTMSRTETTPTGPPSCDTSSVSSDDGTCTLPVSVCSSDTPDSPPESSSMSSFSEMFPESSEQPPPLKYGWGQH